MSGEKPAGVVLVCKAPEDPKKKMAWAGALMRVQVAMWVNDGAACAQCKKPYASVDDFLARGVMAGRGMAERRFTDSFVDEACWPAYEAGR